MIKHAHVINKLSSVFVTELDVLDDVENIKICHRYKKGDQIIDGVLPPLINDFEKLTPDYKTVKGWKVTPPQKSGDGKNSGKEGEAIPASSGISEVEQFDDLPVNAQSFVREIETALKVPVSYISVNNDEDEGVIRIIR